MLAALYNKLIDSLYMRLKDMVVFLCKEFNADVTCFSVSKALKSVDYIKKVTWNIAKERNPDLRANYIHKRSFFNSCQLTYINESGCIKSISTKNKGWFKKGITLV